jgi:hypothetical protein
LPNWPAYASGTGFQRLHIDVESRVEPEPHRNRYLVLDTLYAKQ